MRLPQKLTWKYILKFLIFNYFLAILDPRFRTPHLRLPIKKVDGTNPTEILRGTTRATNNMVSFKYFFWSALFGGVIGVALGAMLTFQIFDDQRHEQADEDEDREVLHPAADMRLQQEAILRLPRREPVEHDYIPEN